MLTFICCDFNTLCVHTYILDLMGGLFQLIYSLDNFKLYEYNISSSSGICAHLKCNTSEISCDWTKVLLGLNIYS